jgi:hypothetical protein
MRTSTWVGYLVVVSLVFVGQGVLAGPFADDATVGVSDSAQTGAVEPTSAVGAGPSDLHAAHQAASVPPVSLPAGATTVMQAAQSAAAGAQPPWADVKTDTTSAFRPSNKTTIYFLRNGKKVSRSAGSSTADDLVALLQDCYRQGIKITELEIKGHGSPELQMMGADTFLIATNRQVLAQLRSGRDIDITPLLRAVLTPDAKVNLNGCKTGRGGQSVAQEFSLALPGRTVTGGALYQMGIPFTAKSWGTKMHYKDGQLVSKKWYRVD